jgi:hypothetical protein
MDVSRLNLLPEPRFLHLWFSHPSLGRCHLSEVSLLDETGNLVKLGGEGSMANGEKEAAEDNGNQDWTYWTLSPGQGTNIPPRVTVRARYTAGPLERIQELTVTSNVTVSMALEGGSQLNGVGQTIDGRAFVAIAVSAKKMQARRFDVVAVARDSREIPATGRSRAGSAGGAVGVERFEFQIPLGDVANFHIGTRPLHTLEWISILLPQQ